MWGRRHHPIAVAGAGLWLAVSPVYADPAEDAVPPSGVELDALMRLPKDLPVTQEPTRKGGATRSQWEERFAAARSDVSRAQASLAKSQAELGELAAESDAWQMAAPGGVSASENSPLSYRLRQEIRQHREELARAEAHLNELRIEANLAGVPTEWQGEPEADEAAAAQEN